MEGGGTDIGIIVAIVAGGVDIYVVATQTDDVFKLLSLGQVFPGQNILRVSHMVGLANADLVRCAGQEHHFATWNIISQKMNPLPCLPHSFLFGFGKALRIGRIEAFNAGGNRGNFPGFGEHQTGHDPSG